MEKIALSITAKDYGRRFALKAEEAIASAFGTVPNPISNAAFDADSDIPSLSMSVKTARFTLANTLAGDTLAEKVADYFARVRSTVWAYVDKQGTAYIMDAKEFETLLLTFGKVRTNASKGLTVRVEHETKALLQWLNQH